MVTFCESQMEKISKNIIIEAINSSMDGDFPVDSLIIVDKNSNGQIESITLDTNNVNKMLSMLNKRILLIFKGIDKGDTSVVDFQKNLLTNENIDFKKNGLVFEIPFGVITNSSFLSNIGPKIPIKIVFLEDLESEIKTEVESYGINNVLFKVYIEIKISEQVLMPISSKKIITMNKIPIITKMIQGDIPSYYFDKIKYNN